MISEKVQSKIKNLAKERFKMVITDLVTETISLTDLGREFYYHWHVVSNHIKPSVDYDEAEILFYGELFELSKNFQEIISKTSEELNIEVCKLNNYKNWREHD